MLTFPDPKGRVRRARKLMMYKLFQGLSRTAHQLTGPQMAATLDAYAAMVRACFPRALFRGLSAAHARNF